MTDPRFAHHHERRVSVGLSAVTPAEVWGRVAAEAAEAALAEAGWPRVTVGLNRAYHPTCPNREALGIPHGVAVRALWLGHVAAGHRGDRLVVCEDGQLGVECEVGK